MTDPRLTRRRLLEGTTGVAIAGLAGCAGAPDASDQQQAEGDDQPGHGEEEHGHDQASEPTPSAEVAVNTARSEGSTEFHFAPHVTWIEAGGTVTWRLESGTHTATAYHPGNDQPRLVPEGTDAWDTGTMSEQGETFEHTFDTEGVYHYLCEPHEQFGMLATVVVGEPHLEDQRALQTLPEDKPEEVHGKLEELNTMVREMVGDTHNEENATSEEDHHEE
ncbi:cupredoxin domain-containing protein [Halonotius sp. GCM10025705]|jgi:plastocyanin|uniref:cupredoxin domain-containing protein n=1 Tax=Halonotius sp. GCM10025705 TaxID=3252678 RepID=UPI003613BCED